MFIYFAAKLIRPQIGLPTNWLADKFVPSNCHIPHLIPCLAYLYYPIHKKKKKKKKLSISGLLTLKHIKNLNVNTNLPSMFITFQLCQQNCHIFIQFFHLDRMCYRYESKQVSIMQ